MSEEKVELEKWEGKDIVISLKGHVQVVHQSEKKDGFSYLIIHVGSQRVLVPQVYITKIEER